MIKKATFYLLKNETSIDGLNHQEALVCTLAEKSWQEGKRVLVACQDLEQAIRLDEALWQRPVDAFVPHNLVDEGPTHGAPVELTWKQHYSKSPRDLLINLLPHFTNFITIFCEVIDFVPHEESLKKLARDRYKAYREDGFFLNIATLHFT